MRIGLASLMGKGYVKRSDTGKYNIGILLTYKELVCTNTYQKNSIEIEVTERNTEKL